MKDTIHSLEEAVERGFTMVARLFAQYGTANMIVPVYDKEGFIEVEYMLKKDDIPAEQRVLLGPLAGLRVGRDHPRRATAGLPVAPRVE